MGYFLGNSESEDQAVLVQIKPLFVVLFELLKNPN
jgi:hypothetical protein